MRFIDGVRMLRTIACGRFAVDIFGRFVCVFVRTRALVLAPRGRAVGRVVVIVGCWG
jgi:hypothetical protein